MADMLTIGAGAASTFKRAIEVTSHNAANEATEGYSRQRAEISSNSTNTTGMAFGGGGSKVSSIERINAEYLQSQLLNSGSMVSRYESQVSLSKQVEGVIAGNDSGVQQFMQRFFDSLQSVANNPTSNTSRQLVLDEMGNLESHINNLTSVLSDTQTQINKQVSGLTTEINSRLQTVQTINQEVERALNSSRQPPNDLLDQRDQAVKELSQYIDIKSFTQENGRVDIFTSNGKLPLLADNKIVPLEAKLSPFQDEKRVELYMTVGGSRQVVSDRISGGELGGVLDFRNNMLDKAQNDLGLMLNGLATSMNWQHSQGFDTAGNPGGNLFEPVTPKVINNTTNTGTEDGSNIVVSFAATDLDDAFEKIGQFQSREYEIRYDNGSDSFNFFDHSSGMPLLDSAQNPVSVVRGTSTHVEGFLFDFTTTTPPNDKDSFLVKPHQDMLNDFAQAINDPNKIAARGPSPDLINPAGEGDNVNIANMASLQSKKLLYTDGSANGATETLLGGYSKMATSAGMYARGSAIQYTAQLNVNTQLVNQRESISGVSLDEEATNLMRYQQAYEAAAQIIATSQSMFQTILSTLRG